MSHQPNSFMGYCTGQDTEGNPETQEMHCVPRGLDTLMQIRVVFRVLQVPEIQVVQGPSRI